MHKGKILFLVFLMLTVNFLPKETIHASLPDFTEYRPHQKETQTGRASWYSETDPGINLHTANMEIFDDSGLTAAMWDVPFDQRVRITNLENGRSVIVRVNDRGPHRRFVREGRLIDLTKQAFSSIASLDKGLIPIQLELL